MRRCLNSPEVFWSVVRIGGPDECWLWTRWLDRDGYGEFSLYGRKRKAHRLAFELATGTAPGPLEVCHRCDVPACCNPAHLFLGTHAENMADMDAKGRRPHGSLHPFARLDEGQVAEIRQRRAAGERGRALAFEYGVHEAVISEICSRKLWRHVA